jgi:hypothetical protein
MYVTQSILKETIGVGASPREPMRMLRTEVAHMEGM